MSEENKDLGLYSLTAPAIMAHPHLFEARSFKGKGEPKFDANFVLDANHPDLAPIKNVIKEVAQAAEPGVAIDAFGKPLKSGSKLADKRKAERGGKYRDEAEYQRDKVVIIARSKYAPNLSVLDNGQVVELRDNEALRAKYKNKFFFGAEAIAEFRFVWYPATKEGDKPGVTAYLQSVLVTGKGTRLTGARPATEAFSGYLGKVSSEDPTIGVGEASDGDEIPF